MNICQSLEQRFEQALTGLVDSPGQYASLIKPAQDARHGDYQANCAMPLAKVLGKPPREIAQTIVDRLDLGDMLHKPEVAGPGFINLRLREDWLARQLQQMGSDERVGVSLVTPTKTYVIDYSSPNVAKPLHVGHLRSTIIGDALTRLLRFLGHKVITDNHLGDWGTQFGILLYGYKNLLDEEAYRVDPVRELARIYTAVRKLFQSDDEDAAGHDPVQQACRAETAKLHAGDAQNLALWREFMPHCLAEIDHVYQRLGILPFNHTLGESFYNPMLAGVVEDMLVRGIAFESDGAIIIPNAKGVVPKSEEERMKEEPPGLIRKRDGAFTYTTSDLATIQYRVEEFQPSAILYVVDSGQSLHFRTLFAHARRWGFERVELEHITFGTVLNKPEKPGGKPSRMATRSGGGTLLEELINQAIEAAEVVYGKSLLEARERGEEVVELPEDERRAIHKAVGVGAIKYADLSQNRNSDYVFDLEKMTATDGNTATYMQYAYARNRSIFRKGSVDVDALRKEPPAVTLASPHERALGMQLVRFNEALLAAASEYRPNLVTAYLWDLAKTYSGFFQNCNVLKAETPELRQSRLLLCDLTARVIQQGLDLLGIRTIERM